MSKNGWYKFKNQCKKYTQKFNGALLAVAVYVISSPEVLSGLDKKYVGWLMLGAVATQSILGAIKQDNVDHS
jgi:hypothetical protein